MSFTTRIFDGLEKVRCLGSGSYGEVWECVNDQHQKCAVKVIRVSDWSTDISNGPEYGLPAHILREIHALKCIRPHENVIPLKSFLISYNERRVGLIFPLLSGLDMYYYLQAVRRLGKRLPYPIIRSFATQLLRGLAHIHAHGIIHRDLKPSNLMVNFETGSVRIIDFGLCRPMADADKTLSMEAFTRMYRPPEVLLGEAHYLTEAVDIWSAGAIIAELFILHPVFRSISPQLTTFNSDVVEDETDFGQVRRKNFPLGVTLLARMFPSPRQLMNIFQTFGTPTAEFYSQFTTLPNFSIALPQWPSPDAKSPRHLRNLLQLHGNISDTAYDFVRSMLELDASKRPTAMELLAHPFLRGTEIVPATPARDMEAGCDRWADMMHPFHPGVAPDRVRTKRVRRVAEDEQIAGTSVDITALGVPGAAAEKHAGPVRPAPRGPIPLD